MAKDSRYASLKVLIESGHTKSFRQIFEHIPRSKVRHDLGMGFRRFERLYQNPQYFTLNDLNILARFIGIDPMKIIELANQKVISDKTPKRRGNRN